MAPDRRALVPHGVLFLGSRSCVLTHTVSTTRLEEIMYELHSWEFETNILGLTIWKPYSVVKQMNKRKCDQDMDLEA